MRSRMTPDATTRRARPVTLWLALILFGLLPAYARATVSVSISASPSGTPCPGTAVTLTATGTPSGCEGTPGSPAYQWSVGGSTVSGATQQTFATSAPASGTVQISCTVSFGSCGSGTGSYNLTTNSSTITCNSISGPSSGTVCASYSFTANATGGCGGGTITYAWTVDGAAQSATGATLGPISLTAATHTISVTAHDSSGTSAAQSKTVTVGAAPGLSFTSGPTASPAAPTTCQSTVTLSASATSGCSGGSISYTWNFGDGSANQTTSNTSLTHAFPAVKTYSVTVTASDGTNTKTQPLSLTVTQGATLQVSTPTASPGSPDSCASVKLTASGTPGCSGSVTSYTWTVDGGTGVTTSTGTYTVGPLGVGTHKIGVSVKDSTGASASAPSPLSLTVTQGAVLKVTSVTASKQSPTTCDQVSFTAATSPGCTGSVTGYTWSVDGGAGVASQGATYGPISLGAGQHTVSVTIKDSNNATASGSLASPLTVTSATPGAPGSLTATASSPTEIDLTWQATTPASTTYNIYRELNGNSYALVTSTSGTSFQDSSVQPSTASHAMDYCYYVVGVSVCGTSGTASATSCAQTPCQPTITIQQAYPSPSAVMVGQSVSFTAVASDSCNNPLTYSWNFGDPSSGSSNTATGATAPHTYAAPGSYTATVTVSDGGSGDSQTMNAQAVSVYAGLARDPAPGDPSGGGGPDAGGGGPGQSPNSPHYHHCMQACSGSSLGSSTVCTDTFSGNTRIVHRDPVATRGYPINVDVTVNTEAVALNRPAANGALTYDIFVGQQAVYNGSCTSSLHWFVVDGDGTQNDFGPAAANPVATYGIFSALSVMKNGSGAVTGFQLLHAGPPENVKAYGNFTYTFNQLGQLMQLTDPEGNAQTLSYTNNLLTQILDVSTQKSVTFDYTGNLVSHIYLAGGQTTNTFSYVNGELSEIDVQDSHGNTLTSATYAYNSDGTLSDYARDGTKSTNLHFSYQPYPSNDCSAPQGISNGISNSAGPVCAEGYGGMPPADTADRVIVVNAQGGHILCDYNSALNLFRITKPMPVGTSTAPVYTYVYNQDHEVTSMSDGTSTVTLAYNENPNSPSNPGTGFLTGVTDNQKDTWAWGWNPSFPADLASSQNPVEKAAGVSDTVAYADSSQQHVPTSTTDSAGNTWSFAHNPHGQITKVTPPPGSPEAASSITYDENSGSATLGYPLSEMDGNGNKVTFDAYDLEGDLLQTSSYPVTGSTATKNTTLIAWDSAQRVTKVTRPDNQSVQLFYVGKNLDHSIDAAGTQDNYSYCASCGALTGISGPLGWSLGWSLDNDKDMLSYTDPLNNTTQYSYGQAEELRSVTYPDTSTLGFLYGPTMLVSQITNGRGDVIGLGYDANERLHQVTLPTTNEVGPVYDYNVNGSIKDFTDAVGTTSYTYSVNGWLQSVQYNYASSGLTNVQELDYTYYPDGLRKSVTWKNGSTAVGTWTYYYDAGGRLTSVVNPFSETTGWAYDGEDKLLSQTNQNGTSTAYLYNQATGWPTNITQSKGSTAFAAYGLTYDNGANTVGNLTGVSENGGSGVSGGASVTYGYNALYQLTSEGRTSGGSTTSHSYGYDLAGNRTSYDSLTIGYDAANKMTTSSGNSSSPFTYDGDGNTTRALPYSNDPNFLKDAYSLQWDDFNHVTNMTYGNWQSLLYDGRGLCVAYSVAGFSGSTTAAATFHIYDGATVLGDISESQSSGTVTVAVQDAYTWGAAGLVSERLLNQGNSVPDRSLWYHFGPQGETRQLTDITGAVADTYGYTAYGVPTTTTGSDTNPYQFGGQDGYYTLPSWNLVLCGLRWYYPIMGRFLSRDPIDYSGGPNLYAYCGDDPVNHVDPSGLEYENVDDDGSSYLSNAQPLSDVMPDPGGVDAAENFLDYGGSFIPGYNIATALSGRDAFGHCLSKGDRWMRGISGVLPLLGKMMGREPVASACGCSFAAGTPVLMADGTTKLIERIHPGDRVLAKDEATGKIEAQDVQSTIHHPAAALVTVTLSGADGKTQAITCTPEHPFYVDGRGWVEAGSLGIGSSIVTRAGPLLAVQGLDWQRSSEAAPAYTVYNFTVDKDHTYFVGSANGGAWVHNGCPAVVNWGSQGKHIFGNSNFIPGRSLLTGDAAQMLSKLGTGKVIRGVAGEAGSQEAIDFGETVGVYINEGATEVSPTTRAIAHYGLKGIHFVPALPVAPE